MNFFKTTLVGRLTTDAKAFPASGEKSAMSAFTVAVNTNADRTTYVDVELRGEVAEKIGQFLVKGKEVLVEGNIAPDAYMDKDGKPVGKLKLYTYGVQLGADPKPAADEV